MLERKTVAIIDGTLPIGLAFNTLAHLALSIGKNAEGIIGKEELLDASGTSHKGLSKYPFIILKADSNKIREIANKARKNQAILVVDFPEQAYVKYTDEELQKALKETKEEDIKYYGVALFGLNEEINKLTKGLRLWK